MQMFASNRLGRRELREASRRRPSHAFEPLEGRRLLAAQELLSNPSFSSGTGSWTLSGDFWAGTNLTNYHTATGYAAGGVDSTGQAKNSANGSMYQQFTIPSAATTASASLYRYITTNETSTSTVYDTLKVRVLNTLGSVLTTLKTYSNLDRSSGYIQDSFNLSSYIGSTIRLQFESVSDATNTTTFRLDDVSVQADVQTATVPAAPTLVSPGTSSSPGEPITTLTPTLKWNAVTGATGYGLYVSDTATSTLVYDNDNVANVNSLTLPAGKLQDGHTYRWNMRAKNATGFSDYSTRLYFNTHVTVPGPPVPAFNSRPSASAKLYLDFNGDAASIWHTDAHGNVNVPQIAPMDFDGDTSSFSSFERGAINEICARVAEKYSPFDINVTTLDPGVYNDRQALRVVMAAGAGWLPGGSSTTGGDAGTIGAFTNGSFDNTAYVFAANFGSGRIKDIAEATAHESGHGFGLVHEIVGSDWLSYYSPSGKRAPIMGTSYAATRGIWWRTNEYPGQDSIQPTQDELSVLSDTSSTGNGFGYRADDHGASTGSATLLTTESTMNASGVIETTADSDWFRFDLTTSASVQVALRRALFDGQGIGMLDGSLMIRNAAGGVVATASSSSLDESLTVSLPAGTYYAVASSAGNYGDVGQYTLGITVTRDTVAPTVSASAFTLQTRHALEMTFSEDLAIAPGLDAVALYNNTTGVTVPRSALTVSYDSVSRKATITFPGYINGVLPDGRYTATLNANAVQDNDGNANAAASLGQFAVLSGDATQDGNVNFADLVILAQNYNMTGRTFSQGNFNYSADGRVDFADLVLLAQHYNVSLPALSSLPALPGSIATSSKRSKISGAILTLA